jgi:membrane protease YdiL (CAAX protease family)
MRLFKLKPDKSTAVIFVLGILIILLSASMILFSNTSLATFMNIVIRDFLMIYVLGFCFPLLHIQKNEADKYRVLGITKNKLAVSLTLNIVFAAILLSIFIWKTPAAITFNYKSMYAISYILVAGIFEMICIYGFIRHYLERAFGIIPAILLTAVIYSLHHAGFQPEFQKLFFVGVMYCSVFYITRNIFIVFPFFWGVGAVWDVLINSTAGRSLQSTTTLFVAIGLLIAMSLFAVVKGYLYERERKIKKQL